MKLNFVIKNDVTIEKITSWDDKLKTEIIIKFKKGSNIWKDKQIEILLAINNTSFFEKIKKWNQVPDKLDNVKIVGLWNIWIINKSTLPIERKYDIQIDFLETMKQYHELLGKENGDNYDSYFFFDKSHFLHYSNTDEIINIIKKYL